MISCLFGRYRYIRLPFGPAHTVDMFQKKIVELFSDMQNVLSIADDILISGFNDQGKDHDITLDKLLWVYQQANMKFNKDKCLFRYTNIPFFGEVISLQGVSLDPRTLLALPDMLPQNSKKAAFVPGYGKLSK